MKTILYNICGYNIVRMASQTAELPLREYEIIDNGKIKYRVLHNPNRNYVIIKNKNDKNIINIQYKNIWIGNNIYDSNEELVFGELGYGHALLLQLADTPNKYVYIGEKVVIFEAGNINRFYSYLVNSEVPYSFALDDNYVYLFNITEEIYKYPLSEMPESNDPDYYSQLNQIEMEDPTTYEIYMEPVNTKNYFRYVGRQIKTIKKRVENVRMLPFVQNIAETNRGVHLPNNVMSHVGSFLSGKNRAVEKQKKELNANLQKMLGNTGLRTKGGKRKTRRSKKTRRTHKQKSTRWV
jgi:hypothetical protein